MRGVNSPFVPDMRNRRKAKVRLAMTTVSPTRNCDHFSCFWLGKVVYERQNIIANTGEFQDESFLRLLGAPAAVGMYDGMPDPRTKAL